MEKNGLSGKVKGEAKEQIGNATNNAKLEAEGKIDKLKGEAQHKISEFKDKLSKK